MRKRFDSANKARKKGPDTKETASAAAVAAPAAEQMGLLTVGEGVGEAEGERGVELHPGVMLSHCT